MIKPTEILAKHGIDVSNWTQKDISFLQLMFTMRIDRQLAGSGRKAGSPAKVVAAFDEIVADMGETQGMQMDAAMEAIPQPQYTPIEALKINETKQDKENENESKDEKEN